MIHAKGGGGGGSSGAVSHAAYLETVHADWLNSSGSDIVTSSVTDAINAALTTSPWTGQAAYDPDTDIAAYMAVVGAFAATLAGLSDTADWNALYTQANTTIDALDTVAIDADIVAFGNVMDDQLTAVTLPRFRRGMQDINAVVSSAFVIGEAVIEGFRNRDVAKYATGLRAASAVERPKYLLSGTEQMLRMMTNRLGLEDGYTKVYIEAMRIKIVAKKEEDDKNMTIDEQDALWDLEAFQYGANIMAAIQGGTASNKIKEPSAMSSAIGGALSGAAAGAMIAGASSGAIAGPVGMAAGAVLGLASSFM
jgi:hypothetical protein